MLEDESSKVWAAQAQELAFPGDEIARIGLAIQELAQDLEIRYRELQQIMQITAQVNAGMVPG
jgi:hypothetical protein